MSLVVIKASEAEAKVAESLAAKGDTSNVTSEMVAMISGLELATWVKLPCPVNTDGENVGEYNWQRYGIPFAKAKEKLAKTGITFERKDDRAAGIYYVRRTSDSVKVTAPVK